MTKTTKNEQYERTQLQKDIIIQRLRDKGCRITKQRMLLLDVILGEECSSCKEIYYKVSMKDSKIGAATVYRMINTLEEIGAISRKNMYKIACEPKQSGGDVCTIELEDNTVITLSDVKWNRIIQTGLAACGYARGQNIKRVTVNPQSYKNWQ